MNQFLGKPSSPLSPVPLPTFLLYSNVVMEEQSGILLQQNRVTQKKNRIRPTRANSSVQRNSALSSEYSHRYFTGASAPSCSASRTLVRTLDTEYKGITLLHNTSNHLLVDTRILSFIRTSVRISDLVSVCLASCLYVWAPCGTEGRKGFKFAKFVRSRLESSDKLTARVGLDKFNCDPDPISTSS